MSLHVSYMVVYSCTGSLLCSLVSLPPSCCKDVCIPAAVETVTKHVQRIKKTVHRCLACMYLRCRDLHGISNETVQPTRQILNYRDITYVYARKFNVQVSQQRIHIESEIIPVAVMLSQSRDYFEYPPEFHRKFRKRLPYVT